MDRLGRELSTLNGWAPEAMGRLQRLAGAIEKGRDAAAREGPRVAMGLAQLAAELRHLANESDDEGGILSRLARALGG
jgi:hypothetical protein